jgi:hypothetical protein
MTPVVITRSRHPLEGKSLQVLGRMRRHGRLELLVVLPDGSKRLIPQAWTDRAVEDADGLEAVATLGSLADLLAVCALVDDLAGREPAARGQADRTSPSQEESDAACPAQFDTRPASKATGHAGRAVAGRSRHGGDQTAGRDDRQGERGGRDRGGRR